MRVGVSAAVPAEDIVELAASVEAAGAESVWVSDHLVWPVDIGSEYPYAPAGRAPIDERPSMPDPWVLPAAAAAVTTTLRLGTSVYILPLRSPLVTAKAIATVDVVSRGRTIAGVGVGWLREEFEIEGINFRERGRRIDEIIEVLRRCWKDEIVKASGEHIRFPAISMDPKPPQGASLPLHVGGQTPSALDRAARLGDGWIGMRHNAETVRPFVETLRRLREQYCRSTEHFEVTVGVRWPLTATDVEALAAAGVDRVLVRPWRRHEPWRQAMPELADRLESLRRTGPRPRGGWDE